MVEASSIIGLVNWRWTRRQERSAPLSIGDPAIAGYFQIGNPNYSGATVGEGSAVALSAVYRAISLIAGTLASLPLRSLRDTGDGMRQRVTSILDNPGGPDGATGYEWKETVLWHLLLHGDAFLFHAFNGAGGLAALLPVHPLAVSVSWPTPDETRLPVGGKWFDVTYADGTRQRLDAEGMTQIPGPSIDGLRGLSPIAVARNSLGTAIAADRAAARMFNSGATISGLCTPEDDLEPDEAKDIKASLDKSATGWENAGGIAVVNRRLKFQPWTMSAVDAQFLESRQFQIEEIARWFGVPPHLLMQTDKQTSWGTGVEEQNRAMGRNVLGPWTKRIEERLSRLLPSPRFVEFDFAALERPAPQVEIDLLIKQVEAGLLTVDEARAIRNLPPLTATDPAAEAGLGTEQVVAA